ncbi:MAG: YggT family protein [Anaerolineae bacterium]|jgi:YggT family protein|nr:YggT family protein [Anaerolineae bacterium]
MQLLIDLVNVISQVLTMVVIVEVLLSYVLPPDHSIRMALNRIVEPLLSPIRRLVPPIASIDFSPVILILLIQVVQILLISLLGQIR